MRGKITNGVFLVITMLPFIEKMTLLRTSKFAPKMSYIGKRLTVGAIVNL